MCCRRMVIGFVDLTQDQIQYGNVNHVLNKETVIYRQVNFERVVSCD